MNPSFETNQRRYELDWLRVLAILAIFVFHCTRFFDSDDWSIKNSTAYLLVDIWKGFTTIWGMPLILLISGASIFYALGKIGPRTYIKGLLARLLLPLALGTFTHIAYQVYLERLFKGEFSGSFFEFYPHYFEGMYGLGGNFAWMGLHLWYLEALFIFSLVLLPLFWWLKRHRSGQRFTAALGALLARPGGPFLFALPVVLLIYSLDPETLGNRNLGGWSVFIYPIFLIAGFLIVSHEGLQARIQDMRWFSLGSGLLLTGLLMYRVFGPTASGFTFSGFDPRDLLLSLNSWCWLLAVIGFGMRYLNRDTSFLKYANEAALPFYILHQTVIVTLGFFVVRWSLPDWVKFLFILACSLLITWLVYEFLVRRFRLIRLLFGMRVPPRASAVPALKTPV